MSPSLGQSQRTESSFERLYRRHRRDVYGVVLRELRDPEEAEDVTQIAFLNAYRAISRGQEPDKPRAWLVTIARNVVRRRYRMLAKRPKEVRLDPEVAAAVADVDGPTAGEIAAAIRRLPENQRAAILLREVQGRPYAEIADELGISQAAVETLIFRARKSLSEALEAIDYVPATRRRARSFFFLPLPGFGKLGSLGLSFGRAGLAAVVGGVAVIVGPPGDSGRAPSPPTTVPGPSSLADVPRFGSALMPVAPVVGKALPRSAPQAGTEDSRGKEPAAPAAGGAEGDLVDGVSVPSVTVPDAGAVVPLPLPQLPVDPPPLPPTPALPPPPLPG